MAKQGVTINVQDGGLGQSPPGLGNVLVVIGCSSTGSPFVPTQTANPSVITTLYGYGPGPECACNIINSTGNPVVFIQVPATENGQNVSAVAKSTNTSTVASVSGIITGTPQDTYYGVVTVATGGTVGTNGIQLTVSLDFNRTTFLTKNLGTATSFAVTSSGVTTGLTVNFTSGDVLVAGDQFFWLSTEPLWGDAAVASAIETMYNWQLSTPEDYIITGGSALRAAGNTYQTTIGAGGFPGTAGAQPSDVVAFDGYMTELFNKTWYNRLLCAAGDVSWGGTSTEQEITWINSLANNFANSDSLRVGVTAGNYNVISSISQTQFRRPLLWLAAARDSAVAIQVDLGRVLDGALGNVTLPTAPDIGFANSVNPFVYHDETTDPGLDEARFMASWTIARRPGIFIMNPNLMAPPGSDFNWLQHGHIMDAACLIVYDFFVEQLSNNVYVYPAGTPNAGQLLQNIVAQLVNGCNNQLTIQLTNNGAASATAVTIPPGQNILATATLNVNVAIVPPGYLKAIVVTMQFQNPAVVQVTVGA